MPLSDELSRRRWTRGVVSAAIFVIAYLAPAAIAAVVTGNAEFVFYISVMLVLIAAIGTVHWRVGLSSGLIWALAIWGGLHMAGGLLPVPDGWPVSGEQRVLYSLWLIPRDGGGGWLKYDQVVHAYGFGVTTWLCWQGYSRGFQQRTGFWPAPTAGLMVLVAAAGCGFGALNEIIEFVATRLTETNVGGYVNTGWDLVSNAVGATIAAMLIYLLGGSARR